MKKTLLALSIAALAANSASALTILDNKDTGTKVDFNGSLRLAWQSTSNTGRANQHINEAVADNGSRFGFKITQDLAEGFYALGRVEWRFRNSAASQHNFEHVYARQLYAGIGHKQLGELTYGNQTVITDEVKQTDLPNKLSLSDGLLDFASRRSVQYVYNAIEGLRVGGYYAGSSKRGDNNLDLNPKRESEYGVAATYRWKLADDQSVKFGTGFTRENYETYHRIAYAFGTAYTFGNTTVGVDLERRETENALINRVRAVGNEQVEQEVRTVVFHRLTDDVNVYGMYAHKTDRRTNQNTDKKQINNQYMIGSEYWIARDALKQYNLRAKTFLEWQTSRIKNSHDYSKAKVRDNRTVIGFRVYW